VDRAKRAGALALSALAFGGIAAASAAVVQQDGIRITVLSQVKPFKLPRAQPAPIAVFLSGHVATATGALPPQLQRMTIEVNRHGLLQSRGLPTCELAKVRTATSGRALEQCEDALVGSGRFWATIVLSDQRPYPTRGRLLVFNGRAAGKPVLYAHIFTATPFPTSFVIAFAIKHVDDGPYGTRLSASLPAALGSWGFVDRIKLTLKRRYRYRGRQRSYFNAACPAPAGTDATAFPLAEASFYFSGRKPITLGVEKACRVAR
jgi:hypothetical protein